MRNVRDKKIKQTSAVKGDAEVCFKVYIKDKGSESSFYKKFYIKDKSSESSF